MATNGKVKICKDCKAEGITSMRATPHPGPRCVTHHRAFKRVQKGKNRDRYAQRTYSLEPGEYERLKAFQGGVCAICMRAKGLKRALSLDHDHKCCPEPPACGQCNRGLLCMPCNDMLGHLRDDTQALWRAILYLTNPPAQQMRALMKMQDGVNRIARNSARADVSAQSSH